MLRQMNSEQQVWQVLRRLAGYISQVRIRFLLSLALMVLSSAMTVAKAWIIQPTVDTYLSEPPDTAQLAMLCGIVLLIFALQGAFNWLFVVTSRTVTAGVARRIRGDLFAHLQRQGPGYFSRTSSSEIISRLITDVGVFESAALGSLQGFIRNSLTLMLLLVFMLTQNLRWGLVWFVVMVTAGYVFRSLARRIITVARRAQREVARITHDLSEASGGIALILAFGATDRWQEAFGENNRRYYDLQVRSTRLRALASVLVDVLTGVGLAIVLFWMGSAVLDGNLTTGQLLAFLAVMFLVQAPAQRLAQCAAGFAQGVAAGMRAFEILDETPELADPSVSEALPKKGGSLRFTGVCFAYENSAVIDDLSFVIQPREFVLLAGASGAGKSTVTSLAQRFYDVDSGQVLVDDIDVRNLTRKDLSRAISYVSQENFLFDDSIYFNITMGRPDADPARIDEVIRLACLRDVIDKLPDGLETRVGERGVRLSGGQRQRIAIARALLTDSRILILDEATSALDMELERQLFTNLARVRERRTVLAITHRLTMAAYADRVLVLSHGRLVEQGSSDTLIVAGGEFARLQRTVAEEEQ